MRKIQFNEETVNSIRNYIQEGHTKRETCNRFTIKLDTLNRVMRENDIKPFHTEKINKSANKPIADETVNLVCNLFENTMTSLQDICKEAKIEYWEMQKILKDNFSQYDIDRRKSKMYAKSKMGYNNPMKGKCKENHHNYKGIIDDGNGYSMILKPDWYTGRKNSKHIFLHHAVICEHLGITEIPKGFCVHHIDGNKKNNDISNLCLLSMGAHTKLHQLQNRMCKVQRLSKNGVGNTKPETLNNNRSGKLF